MCIRDSSKGRTQTPEGEPDKPDDNPDSGETDNGSEPEPQEPQVGYASVSVALPDNTDMAHVVISVDGMVQYLSLIHIYIPRHHVLIGNTAAGGIEIIPARAHEPLDRIRLVHRHNGGARLVVRRVQRHGQGDLQLLPC